jgi:sugar phosphate isomerase/epimerase
MVRLLAGLIVAVTCAASVRAGLDAYKRRDYSTAFREWSASAAKGTADAEYQYPSDNPPAHIREWLTEAAERAAADGLTLMIEPEPICWCDTGRATVSLLHHLANVKINYDPGNVAWLTNRDPIDEFDTVAPYIANVHVKDIRPVQGDPEWVPAGEGIVDYAAHFRALQAIGYRGPISLEPHMDCSAEATRRCKDALTQILLGIDL